MSYPVEYTEWGDSKITAGSVGSGWIWLTDAVKLTSAIQSETL